MFSDIDGIYFNCVLESHGRVLNGDLCAYCNCGMSALKTESFD